MSNNAKYHRCHERAINTAEKMGYRHESHGVHDVVLKHKKTGKEITIPCANHSRKRFTLIAWERIMSELVLGATDEQQG